MDIFDEATFSREDITNPLATALKTTFLVIGVTVILSTILNIPIYLVAGYLPLSQFGFTVTGFMDILPVSYLGVNIFSVLALMKYLSICGKPLACTWYLL
jgi:hypothetical protein